MALIVCRECSKRVSDSAKYCPSCGAKRPGKRGPKRDWTVALILAVLLGWLGVDRFYMGHVWLGLLKLITFGGLGVWWAIDIILVALKKVDVTWTD